MEQFYRLEKLNTKTNKWGFTMRVRNKNILVVVNTKELFRLNCL